MMDVDAKGYEEKPWWPYVLDLQQKIDASGGGGGDFTIAKVVVKAGDGVTLPVSMPMATVVHADSASGAPNTILARLYYIAKGQTVEFETPLYKGLYVCAVESTPSSGPTITGAAEYNAEQQMLTITGDCTIEW